MEWVKKSEMGPRHGRQGRGGGGVGGRKKAGHPASVPQKPNSPFNVMEMFS